MKSVMYCSQKGFTLVEIMIAFTLSAILMLGLFQIFNANKQAFSLQDGMARVQESGRISTEILGREVRSAGYTGCATGSFSTNFQNHVDATKYADSELRAALGLFNGDNGIIAFDNVTAIGGGSTLDDLGLAVGTGVGEVISGTDVLMIQSVEACAGGEVVVGGTGTAQLKVADASACGLDQGDIVVVSNCNTAEAFGITSNASSTDTLAHGANYNIQVQLTGTYDDDSYIYKPTFSLFYVGNGTNGEPALYMKSLVNEMATNAFGSFELAESVEDIQFLYGEDTNDDRSVDRYVVATDVSDFNSVMSIKAQMLVRSQDGLTQNNQTYEYNGASVVAGDNRMRVPYVTTIAIRNRVR